MEETETRLRELEHDRELSREELLEYLAVGAGATPGSRYGSHSSDMVDVALAAASIVARESGEPLTIDMVDGVMSQCVNDSAEPAELIRAHGTEEERELVRSARSS